MNGPNYYRVERNKRFAPALGGIRAAGLSAAQQEGEAFIARGKDANQGHSSNHRVIEL